MKNNIFWAFLGLCAVGCSQQTVEGDVVVPRIHFFSSIDAGDAVSRAPVATNAELFDVTFLRKDGTVTPTDFSGGAVLTAKRATDGTITFNGADPVYDVGDKNAYFVAYHPQGSVSSEVVTWRVDGKTDVLVTPTYDAGKYSAPHTGAMTFKHQLAQLEVVCKADDAPGSDESLVQLVWGKITKIELMDTPTERTYTYATNAVGDGATLGALPLLQADYETTFADVAITKNAAAVVAAGMFVPASTGVAPLKLKVYTEVDVAGREITVQLKDGAAADKGFEMGKRHTVTLVFKASDKDIEVLATTIEPWVAGYSGTGGLIK